MTGLLKKISPTSMFLIVVLLVMAVFFVTSMGYKEPKVKLMPMIMSGAAIVLAGVAVVEEFRSGAKSSAPTDEEGDVIEDENLLATPLIAYFKAFGWFAAAIACVYVLGFLIAIPVWMIVFLWKNGFQWWKAVPQGIGLTIIIYVVFTMVLQIELYQGLVGQLLS
jgi:hypothetical protein